MAAVATKQSLESLFGGTEFRVQIAAYSSSEIEISRSRAWWQSLLGLSRDFQAQETRSDPSRSDCRLGIAFPLIVGISGFGLWRGARSRCLTCVVYNNGCDPGLRERLQIRPTQDFRKNSRLFSAFRGFLITDSSQQKPSAFSSARTTDLFPSLAQRIAFHHRGVRQRSPLFAVLNPTAETRPNSNRIY